MRIAMISLFLFLLGLGHILKAQMPGDFGTVVSISSSSVSIIQASDLLPTSFTKERTFAITPKTQVTGCSLQEVKIGAICTIETSGDDTNQVQELTSINFITCNQTITAQVVLEDVTNTSASFVSNNVELPFDFGSRVKVGFADNVQTTECYGATGSSVTLFNNRPVVLQGSVISTDSVLVSYVQSTDDCPTRIGKIVSLVSVQPTSITVVDERNNTRQFSFLRNNDGSVGDTSNVQLETCSWELFTWSQLQQGDTLYLSLNVYKDGTVEVVDVAVAETCNPGFGPLFLTNISTAKVVSVSQNLLNVKDELGDFITYTLTPSVVITSCSQSVILAEDLQPGQFVNILVLTDFDGSQQVLSVSSVENCLSQTFVGGLITSVESESIQLLLRGGNRITLPVSDDCIIVDCAQTVRTAADNSMVGAFANALVEYTNNQPRLIRLDVEVNCPTFNQISAKIVEVDDTRLVAADDVQGNYTFNRDDIGVIVNSDYSPATWSELTVGDNVCIQQAVVGDRKIFVAIARNSNCLEVVGTDTLEQVFEGVINTSNGAEIELTVNGATVDVVTSAQTGIIGVEGVRALQPGMTVKVLSKGLLYKNIPIAKNIIVVQSTTSVEESLLDTSTMLFPNPANSIVYLKADSELVQNISVLSFAGETVLQSGAVNQFNVSQLQSGNYTVAVQLTNGSTVVKMLKVVH